MSESTLNPYAAPQTAETSVQTVTFDNPWKTIAWRWERLRLVYNFLVGGAGVLALVAFGGINLLDAIAGAMVYGAGANVFFTFGPMAEMYLNWLVDVGEHKFLPGFVVALVRSPFLTSLFFVVGTGFSVLLTLALASSMAWTPT